MGGEGAFLLPPFFRGSTLPYGAAWYGGIIVGEKQFDRLRISTGQHRRVLAAALALGIAAFVPVGLRL